MLHDFCYMLFVFTCYMTILHDFDILPNFPFIKSETERDYLYQTCHKWVSSRVAQQLQTLGN